MARNLTSWQGDTVRELKGSRQKVHVERVADIFRSNAFSGWKQQFEVSAFQTRESPAFLKRSRDAFKFVDLPL